MAVLTTSGLSPVEAIVIFAGWQDRVSRRFLQATRLWDDDAWDAALDGPAERGWAEENGLTATGMAFRQDIEDRTDEAAAAPWENLGEGATRRLRDLLRPVAEAASAGFPGPVAIPETMPA